MANKSVGANEGSANKNLIHKIKLDGVGPVDNRPSTD